MLVAQRLFAREIGRHAGLFRILAFLCGLSYYPLAYWSLLGMETGLLAVLLSLSVLLALGYAEEPGPARGLLLSASLGLAFLTRPDAAVFALPLFAYAFFGGRKRVPAPQLLALVGPFALIVAGQELFRWGYYGELVPNTYTLKMTGVPLLDRIENGANFVAPFLTEVRVPLVLAGVALLFDFRKGKLLLAGVFAAAVLYQVWVGGDAWNYWRFLSPAVPLVLVLAAREVFGAVASVSDAAWFRRYFMRNPVVPSRHVPGLVVALAVLAVLFVANFRFMPEITLRERSREVEFSQRRVNVALALERLTTPDATIGRFGAGTVPYYAGRPAIDFLGKADPRIARLAPDLSHFRPGHNKYDLEYSIKELRPTHAQGFEWYGHSVLDWAENEYVRVNYKGVGLNLLRGSEEVRWDEVYEAVEAGEASLKSLR
jgi:arabinofuranosyltransferase